MDISNIINLEPWWRFAAALLIGALIGLEREFIQQKEGEPDFVGIRTFSLISLLGAVTAHLSPEFGFTPALIAFVGLIMLTVIGYVGDIVIESHRGGVTTEVAVLLTFFLGAMVIWDRPEIAISLAVIIALLLTLKAPLHELARRMDVQDLRYTIEFALVAAVVLPILPNHTIDPLGVVNPSQIWLLVVFVSGIGFVGYVLMKALGTEQGVGLTGLLGGIVSSTATTLNFSTRSKESPALSSHFAQAILLASTVMFPRVLIEVLVVNAPLLRIVALPLAAMLLAGLAVVIVLRGQVSDETLEEDIVDLANPLRLTTAVMFGLVFAVVLVAVRLAEQFLGDTGVYLTSIITGLTDVNAITLSAARLAGRGQLDPHVAGSAIIIAAVVNTFAKAGIALSVGAPRLRRTVMWTFGVVIAVGLISIAALFLMG
jgi:uncharacterized membrane protein (DUF4010 family)